jgi:hypothetical protein
MNQSDEVVACLENLSKAFSAYDRALFYYDPAFDRHLSPRLKREIDTEKTYSAILQKLPSRKSSRVSGDNAVPTKAELNRLHLLGTRAVP